VLSSTNAAAAAVIVCALTAALEGVCAGRNIRAFFDTVRFPPYAAPLWLWPIIGAVYYIEFGFVVFRLLTAVSPTSVRHVTLALIIAMMVGNALSNLVIFRARDLRLGYVIGLVFGALDLILFTCLLQLDFVAAWALVPYLHYRVYAIWWSRAVARLNPDPCSGGRY
jgi:tryptophan-rich sensory protein